MRSDSTAKILYALSVTFTRNIMFENYKTEEELYTAMVDLVNPILNEENNQRELLIAEYKEKIKPAEEVFDNSTVKQLTNAKSVLEPHKNKLDENIKKLVKKHELLIDKLVKEFGKKQAAVQARFLFDTQDAQAIFDAAIIEDKTALELKLEELGKSVDAKVTPINEAYRAAVDLLGIKND